MILVIAQADPATAAAVKAAVESADFLSTKDFKWWFIFILILGAAAALLVLKWLLASHQKYMASMETQLVEQRAANKELNEKLLGYIVSDHAKSIEAQNTFSSSIKELAQAVKELSNKTTHG